MKNKKCVHPRKANRFVKEFIDEVVGDTFRRFVVEYANGNRMAYWDCTLDELLEDCADDDVVNIAEIVPTCRLAHNCGKTEVRFSAFIGDYMENGYFTIAVPRWKTARFDKDKGGKLFRKDFVSRSSCARGFSTITLSLLHEIGHFMTEDDIDDDYDRIEVLKELHKKYKTLEAINNAYFNLPDESMATDWAIGWLNNGDNRKVAKKFEKKFFACFE